MVHSKGTRSESHRFKMERTGSTKYSGRSFDLRWVSAGGAEAARRAMPTNGARNSAPRGTAEPRVRPSIRRGAPCGARIGGGQAAEGQPGTVLFGPAPIGARSASAQSVRLWASAEAGKSTLCRSGIRRVLGVAGVAWAVEHAGDIAHLTTGFPEYFAFYSLCQALSFALYSLRAATRLAFSGFAVGLHLFTLLGSGYPQKPEGQDPACPRK